MADYKHQLRTIDSAVAEVGSFNDVGNEPRHVGVAAPGGKGFGDPFLFFKGPLKWSPKKEFFRSNYGSN